MTDETSSGPSSESDKPIILGGPISGDHVAGDEEAPPLRPPEQAPERAPEPVSGSAPLEPMAEKRSAVMPVLGVVGFVFLAVAIGYLWARPQPLPSMPPDESGAVTALQSDMAALKTRLAALDARETSDIGALHAAIAALQAPAARAAPASATPAAATPVAAPDTALLQQVSSLADRLDHIQAAEAAQAEKAQSLPSAADLSTLGSRIDGVAQRESKDDAAIRQDLALVQQQLATLSGQAQSLTKSETQTGAALPHLTAQADRLSQLVRAQEALRAGTPLGTIANAPPALSRFADTAPPTEAALRLSFTDAAKAADKAGQPVPDTGRFWHRVWVRAQRLVMVRQGDHVILGDPTSATLAHAETMLDAGDLAGTLTVLATLTGPAAAAMAPWEAQARALLAARAALAQMAAG
jgi:hypothetical protein